MDNYNREAKAFLPKLKISLPNQVVQVINEQSDEVIYTLRIKGDTFTPQVFEEGNYTVVVGEGNNKHTLKGLHATKKPPVKEIVVEF